MSDVAAPSAAAIKEDSHTMSFDFSSIAGLNARMAPVQKASTPQRSQEPNPTHPSDAVKLDVKLNPTDSNAIPASPPHEVLDAMGTASAAYDRLAASGRGLSFAVDDATGKVVVSVHDTSGKVLFTVPASKALEIASGGSLDQ